MQNILKKDQVARTASFVSFTDIIKNPIEDWPKYLEEGKAFLATAQNAYTSERKIFTPEILYNVVAMGIEKLIMAMLMKSGNLPYNHTIGDLVDAMDEFIPGNMKKLGAKLKALDAFQEICDLEKYTIKIPTKDEIKQMLSLAQELKSHAIAYTNN